MDHIILTLLYLNPRTIYEIRAKFEGNLGLMYSSSMGSIQAAIRKLLKNGYITYTEVVENGKYKKRYQITEGGREQFSCWINSPFGSAQNRNPELAKLYFMGLSDPQTRIERIQDYIASLKEYHAALELIYQEGEAMHPPEEYAELFQFQLVTVRFGMDSVAFEIEWLCRLVTEIEEP